MKTLSRLLVLLAISQSLQAGTEKLNQSIQLDACGAYFSLLHGWHTRPPLTDEQKAVMEKMKLSKRQQKDFGTYYFDSLLSFEDSVDAAKQKLNKDQKHLYRLWRSLGTPHGISLERTKQGEFPPRDWGASALVHDARRVGPLKPVSVLYSLTESDVNLLKRSAIIAPTAQVIFLENKGEDETLQLSRTYVYDDEALMKILNSNKTLLESKGWPTDAESFLRRVNSEVVPETDPIHGVIAIAFGDSDTLRSGWEKRLPAKK